MARIAVSETAERSRTFLARLGDFIRQLLLVALLLGAAGAVAWMYVQSRADGEICACVEKKLIAHYAGQALDVSIGGARRIEGKGIELRRLMIGEFGAEHPIVEVDEVFLACSTDLQDLVTQQVAVRHVELRRPKIRAIRDRKGDWNFAKLLRRQEGPFKAPTIAVENGRIELLDKGLDSARTLTLFDIQAEVTPGPDLQSFRLKWPDEEPAASGRLGAEADVVRVRGSLAGEHLRRGEVELHVNVASGAWSVEGSLQDLTISPELSESLPLEVASRMAALSDLRGVLRIGFQAESRDAASAVSSVSAMTSATSVPAANDDAASVAAADAPTMTPVAATPTVGAADALPRFLVTVELTEGRYEDSRLPAPLTDLEARLSADNRDLKLEQLTAKCGPATLQAAGQSRGYSDESPLSLRLRARNFELNDHVARLLPQAARNGWDKFAPRGTVHADLVLQFDGKRWLPELTVEFLDVSFAYAKFPFRLHQARGTIRLKEGLLQSDDLQALANERTVRLRFQVRDPGERFYGWVELASEGPVPLDEKVFVAMATEQEKIVRSLRPRGEVTVWGRFGRRRPEEPIERRLEIGLHECQVNFVGFAYPLERVRGLLAMTNGQWEFRDLRGQNDSALVECKGTWTPTGSTGHQLTMTFEVSDLPLDDELKSALKPGLQRFWSGLRPRGSIDHVSALVQFHSVTKELSLDVRAQKWPPKQNVEGSTVSMQPTWLPYQWDNVTGEVRYRDGEIDLKDLRATHGRTSLQLAGAGRVTPEGRWNVGFSKFIADRVTLDQELMVALPIGFGETAARLNFNGPIGVQGEMELAGTGKASEIPLIHWNLTLDVENGSMKVGLPLQQIRGSVQLNGAADQNSFYSQGELDIHSLLCNDIQLTQIKGPIRIEPTRMVFGDFWANSRTLNRPPRQVTGRLFGGSASADAVVALGADLKFDLLATLNDADMALISRDALPTKRDISGRTFATLKLQGTDKGAHSYVGEGKVTLREADVYDVPVASSVFNRLKVRRLDVAGFTSCDMAFRVQGDRLYFNQIDLIGNAMTLKGTGEMGLDRQVNLNFYTMVGREEMRVPLLTPVLAEASRQLFEIQVHGTLDEPRIDQRAVPVISDALRQAFPELSDRAEARAEARADGKGLLQRIPSPRQVMERGGLTPKR